MAFRNTDASLSPGTIGASSELLNKNWMVTGGLAVGAGVGVTSVVIVASALPAQMLGMSALGAGLVYFGDKQHKATLKERKADADKSSAEAAA